jgi:hypothetical protein
MAGQAVCGSHGGRSPAARRKAAQRMAERKIFDLAQTFGTPVEGADPGVVILERIGTLAGHVRWLQSRVEALTPDEVVWGTTREKTGGHDAGVTDEARPSVWVELYERWNAALVKLCLEAVRIGLQERQVRVAEQQGALICAMLDGLLTELGHNPNDPATAAVVVRHLQLVAAESSHGQLEQGHDDDDDGWDDELEAPL